MPIYRLNNSGVWKKLSAIYRLNNNGNWRPLSSLYRLSNLGNWRKIFASEQGPEISQQVTISQDTPDALTGLITLTGTNYNWTNTTSLRYFFEWYNISQWDILEQGTITNPPIGSPNTKSYTVQIADTNTNTDNLYRFRVRGTNVVLFSNSTSATTTISTPRNITWSSPAISNIVYNGATLNFTSGGYANSYKVRIVNTTDNTTTYQTISSSPGTLTGLTANKNYTVYITGYTSASALGYPGNESSGQSFSTPQAPAPLQLTRPATPSGTGEAFTSVSAGTSGTYNNIVGFPSTFLHQRLITLPTPTDGLNFGSTIATPYKITQFDATYPQYTYYTVDVVTGVNGNTYYYYSLASVTAFIGSFTDNFNRANTVVGFGTMTPAKDSGMSPSSYIYDFHQNPATNTSGQSWKILSNVAYNDYNVAQGDPGTNFSMYTLDVGRENVNLRATIPSQKGDNGVAFWVTARGSWYAVVPKYGFLPSETVPVYGACKQGGTDSLGYGSTAASIYNNTTVGCSGNNTANCTGYYSKYTGTTSVFSSWGACLAGSPQSITQSQYNSCGCSGNYTSSCSGFTNCSSSTVNTYGACIGGASESISQATHDATNVGCSGNNTANCTGYYSKTATTISKNTFSVVVCFGGSCFCESGYEAVSCPNPECGAGGCSAIPANDGKRCTPCTLVSTTTYSRQPCASNLISSTITYSGSPCVSNAIYTTETTYFRTTCMQNQTGTTTIPAQYKTYLGLYSSVSGTVTSELTEIASSSSAYNPVGSFIVSTSGNTISATAYSDTGFTFQYVTSLSASKPSATKSLNGQSGVGVIRTETAVNGGLNLDNFQYTRV